MEITKSEYDIQAEDFLNKTQTFFSVKFLENGKYFPDDKEARDIYEITLLKKGREYKFRFGQSINCSAKFRYYDKYKTMTWINFNNLLDMRKYHSKNERMMLNKGDYIENKGFKESRPYDVLASLTKFEVGTFENFCSEFGYNSDSKHAEKIYNAVVDEYLNIQRLFNDDEIALMREIN